jgi:hypothetical protein
LIGHTDWRLSCTIATLFAFNLFDRHSLFALHDQSQVPIQQSNGAMRRFNVSHHRRPSSHPWTLFSVLFALFIGAQARVIDENESNANDLGQGPDIVLNGREVMPAIEASRK